MRTLFVISDLHLGGRPPGADHSGKPPFRINHAASHLAGFIDWVGAEPGDVELVVNGDIVDFLAEDDAGPALAWTASEEDAIARLDQVHSRTPEVFDALRRFMAQGKRLTLLLGNHDGELSLPAVRRHLFGLLGSEPRFVFDGEAYVVGRVLIEHGNRYDRWNMLDYSGLRQERSMRSRGLPVDEAVRDDRYFTPPAGSRLVVDVMNHLKARYRFIDLLKPETSAVIPLLLALEPELWSTLGRLLRSPGIFRRYAHDGLAQPAVPKHSVNLNQQGGAADLGELLAGELGLAQAQLFVEDAKKAGRIRPGELPLGVSEAIHVAAAATRAAVQQALDKADSMAALLRIRKERLPQRRLRELHAALVKLNERDGSFDTAREDATYLDAAGATAAGGRFDVIVYGHTHLPKKIALDRGWYVNTGTWCDVMRLPPDIARPFAEAAPALEAFVAAVRDNDYDTYVRRYLSYARIEVDPTGAQPVAEPALHSYCGPGRPAGPPLTPCASHQTSGGSNATVIRPHLPA